VKGSIGATATSLNWACNVLIAQLFPLVVRAVGVAPTYLVFAAVNVCAAAFGALLMVETSRRPLHTIFDALYVEE